MRSGLVFSANDLAVTRFAVSPMWEVVTSFRLLTSGSTSPVHRRWMDQVKPRLAAAGLDSGWLADLVPPKGYLCDFLTPPPTEPAPALESELAAVRDTPAEHVLADLAELGGTTARRQALRAHPEARLARIAEEINVYWELALAPYWARIRAVLDSEVYHRARQVAEHGAAHLFNDLHATLRWDDDTLWMVRRECGISREKAGAGLLLIPSAFATNVLTWFRLSQSPQLAYPARGAGTLWEPRPVLHAEAIAAVIGRSRTRLLTELEAPASTTDLASRTGISAAGVSQHLVALRNAGMVSAHRVGHYVLYARTAVAESFLTAAS